MGVIHKNTTAAVSNPAASAETVIYTTPAVQTGQSAPVIGISGTAYITPGTGTTAVVIRVRQGSLAGPVVSLSPSHGVTAGTPAAISFGATDTSTFTEQVGGGAYVITAQQTGGTGAGTTNGIDVEVIV